MKGSVCFRLNKTELISSVAESFKRKKKKKTKSHDKESLFYHVTEYNVS